MVPVWACLARSWSTLLEMVGGGYYLYNSGCRCQAYTITIVQQVVDKAFIEKSITAIYLLGVQVIVAFGAKGAFTYAKALIMSKGGLLASANLQRKSTNT